MGESSEPNPYSTPESPVSDELPPSSIGNYRPLEGLVRVLLVAFSVIIVSSIATAIDELRIRGMLDGLEAGSITLEEVQRVEDLHLVILGVGGIAVLVTGILFCVWMVRSRRNAIALGGRVRYSSWSWIWFAVPIANLFMPYQAIKEYWISESSSGSWRDQAKGRDQSAPVIVLLWWLAFVVWLAADRMAARMPYETLDEYRASLSADFVASLTSIVAAALAIPVLLNCSRHHREVASRLQGGGPARRFEP